MRQFQDAIQAYLDQRAVSDPLFAVAYAKKNKNIKQCCDYCMGEAQKQAVNGAAAIPDEVVFGWAVHYYDEDDIKINHVRGHALRSDRPHAEYKPTEEDMEAAKKAALKRLEDEAYQKLHAPKKTKREPVSDGSTQMSLFA